MAEKKQRLVREGNAFYEVDLECIRRMEEKQNKGRRPVPDEGKRKRQRD